MRKVIEIESKQNQLMTEELQSLIDEASKKEACLVLKAGVYLTGPLFLKSHMELCLEEGAILKATTDETYYPLISTRVAGIEMEWFPAILNCIDQEDVTIKGFGIIDGQGPYWWEKYWGKDMHGGMRKEYDAKGLRWACDYDCMRPRNVLVSNSKNIVLKEFTSYQSGFWNIHLLYSEHVVVDGIHILSSDLMSPSTDGVDIDSCSDVLVQNSIFECNDDSIAIKSGRDEDGKRVGIPCHDITICHCQLKSGFGITIGSEVSGGIYNISIHDITYDQTDCGFRIKSSFKRGGFIQNVDIRNLEMLDVKYLFHICLNWNPNYCECSLPKEWGESIPKHYQKLMEAPSIKTLTSLKGISIQNVKAQYRKEYTGISRAFHIEGFQEQPIEDISFKHMNVIAKEYGVLRYVKNCVMEDCTLTITEKENRLNDEYDNR